MINTESTSPSATNWGPWVGGKSRNQVRITIGSGVHEFTIPLHDGAVKDAVIEALRSAGLITVETVAVPGPALVREMTR